MRITSCIFESYLKCPIVETISSLNDYRVFHYGAYDAIAMKRVAANLQDKTRELLEGILQKFVNVLSFVHPHIYFPTYSNSLKNIMSFFGCNFFIQEATGLNSIVWRMQWESSSDSRLKTRLLEYNQADCMALKHLTDFVTGRISRGLGTCEDIITVNRTEEMVQVRPHWQLFAAKSYALEDLRQVNKSAYFDYQREKVFIRTHPQFKSINRRAVKSSKNLLSNKPNKTFFFEKTNCPNCKSPKINRDCGSESSHIIVDLKFSKGLVKKYITRFVSWRYKCLKCGRCFRSEDRLPNPQRYGHGLASWCVYQNNVLGVNMSKVRKSLVDMFGLHIDQSVIDRTKDRIAVFYEPLYVEILSRILASPVLHIDETTVKLLKLQGYVWVLTTLDKVYYIYRPTRETEFLRELLASFRGVLVSDFYTGYDFLPCEQQKCIVHLIRDLDDDLLRNPLDEDLECLAQAFGILMRSIVSTIDRFGLRCRNLRKHKIEVDKFMKEKVAMEGISELANKYRKRFRKYCSRMFTFLDHNGVPWNNNNAEHAIKRFVKYRRDTNGKYSEKTLREYLILASVFETCEFNNVNVLRFLLSKEQAVDKLLRMGNRKAQIDRITTLEA